MWARTHKLQGKMLKLLKPAVAVVLMPKAELDSCLRLPEVNNFNINGNVKFGSILLGFRVLPGSRVMVCLVSSSSFHLCLKEGIFHLLSYRLLCAKLTIAPTSKWLDFLHRLGGGTSTKQISRTYLNKKANAILMLRFKIQGVLYKAQEVCSPWVYGVWFKLVLRPHIKVLYDCTQCLFAGNDECEYSPKEKITLITWVDVF
jgi:hypothetical protein